jgi:hypothetical protein
MIKGEPWSDLLKLVFSSMLILPGPCLFWTALFCLIDIVILLGLLVLTIRALYRISKPAVCC